MSSFTDYIPGYQPTMDRFNPGRKRHAPRLEEVEIARRTQQNPMFFTDDDDNDSLFGNDEPIVINNSKSNNDSHRSPLVSSRNTQPARRTTTTFASAVTHPQMERHPRPAASTAMSPSIQISAQPVEIKDEIQMTRIAHVDFSHIPPNERVRIFVGRRSRSVYMKRSDLSKSPILLSYIVDDPAQGAFIMRPQLMSTNVEDFDAVSQYLRSAEYAPLLLEDPQNREGPKILDGLNSDEQYAKELIRCGKLYRLAKDFGVEGMPELVFRKVSEVDAGKFDILSLVKITDVVFRNRNEAKEQAISVDTAQEATSATEAGGTNNTNAAEKDSLEEWIIDKLAFNFQEIMRTQREIFWAVVKRSNKNMMYPRVLDEIAERYRATGGKLPEPVIQLD